jgi:hypothetical protein
MIPYCTWSYSFYQQNGLLREIVYIVYKLKLKLIHLLSSDASISNKYILIKSGWKTEVKKIHVNRSHLFYKNVYKLLAFLFYFSEKSVNGPILISRIFTKKHNTNLHKRKLLPWPVSDGTKKIYITWKNKLYFLMPQLIKKAHLLY